MRLGKSSPQKTPEKKSATPYKNMSGNRNIRKESARPVHTTVLPKSQRPSRQLELTEQKKAKAAVQKRSRYKRARGKRIGHTILLLLILGAGRRRCLCGNADHERKLCRKTGSGI